MKNKVMKSKLKPFDQFLYHDIEDELEAYQYKEEAMPLIGWTVLNFNRLESELNSVLCKNFTDRTDSTGLIVLHRMAYSTKVELFERFNNDLFSSVEWRIPIYDRLIEGLRESGRLRNVVVHADWENTDENGFTFVRLQISKHGMSQEYIQLSVKSLRNVIALIISTRRKLEQFWERRNELLFS